MKKINCFVLLLFLLFVPIVSASAAGIDGDWNIDVNNNSFGVVHFYNNGTSGLIEIDGRSDSISKLTISDNGLFGTKEITFIRNGFLQVYQGSISMNGCLMAGFEVNVNDSVQSSEKFPFYAKNSSCP